MFGWCSVAARRASFKNMFTKLGLSLNCGKMRFTHTSFSKPSMPTVRVKYSSAIPPTAICRITSYFPSLSPGARERRGGCAGVTTETLTRGLAPVTIDENRRRCSTMKPMGKSLAAAVLVALVTGCNYGAASFHCETPEQCGAGAFCELSYGGICSFPVDTTICPSGRRFGELSGPNSTRCVGEQPPPIDAAIDAAIDAPPDAPPDRSEEHTSELQSR